MAQEIVASNPGLIGIGRQKDLAIGFQTGLTPIASSTTFLSSEDFDIADEPSIIKVEDATGNISGTQSNFIDMIAYPFTYSMALALDNIFYLIYAHAGKVTSVQDGSTGAYTHTYEFLNNVIKPYLTVLQHDNARGHFQYTSGHVETMNIEISDSGGKISGSGYFMQRNQVVNSAAEVTGFTVTDAAYQSGSFNEGGSVMLYTLSAADFSTVVNGDVLIIPADATGFANDEHKGFHDIISADDGANTVLVANRRIYDNSKDETTLTTAGAFSVKTKIQSNYVDPQEVMLLRHATMKVDDTVGGLAAALAQKASNFKIETSHNSKNVPEAPGEKNFLLAAGTGLTGTGDASQLMKGSSAAEMEDTLNGVDNAGGEVQKQRALRLTLEDTDRFLGTSLTLHPKIEITLDRVLSIGKASGANNDHRMIDWAYNVANEMAISIVVQNEVATPVV